MPSDKLPLRQADLPGPEARLFLTNLARESVFLDLPRGGVPSLPPPALQEQRRMMQGNLFDITLFVYSIN